MATSRPDLSKGAAVQVVHCDTPAGRLGLMTCYDIRFPWLSDLLRGRGAEILTYPSAFTVKTGAALHSLPAPYLHLQTPLHLCGQAGQHARSYKALRVP